MADFSDGSWCPALPMEVEDEWRLQTAQFGDGYEQRALDGINALKRTFKLSFEKRPQAQVLAMQTYLVSTYAHAFAFKEPASGVVYQVFCDTWSISWEMARKSAAGVDRWGTLKADFRVANGVTIT